MVRSFCQFNNIEINFLPSYSPEFKSIEPLLSVIKRRFKSKLVAENDIKIDLPKFQMLLTETLESVTPEEARRAAASNNQNFLYNMLIQMKRIELNDRNLETLQEMDVEQVDSVSAHSDTPDENEYQSSSAFADVGAFLYVANNQ